MSTAFQALLGLWQHPIQNLRFLIIMRSMAEPSSDRECIMSLQQIFTPDELPAGSCRSKVITMHKHCMIPLWKETQSRM